MVYTILDSYKNKLNLKVVGKYKPTSKRLDKKVIDKIDRILEKDDMVKIKEAFDIFDVNKDGKLKEDELINILSGMGGDDYKDSTI